MRHRHYRRWKPERKHYRRYRKESGYKAIAETALQVIGTVATALVVVLFKRKP